MPGSFLFQHHTMDLLKASLPFMNPNMQHSIEVLSKADEFIQMVQSPAKADEINTMSIPAGKQNFEELLEQLKSVSSKQEQDMLDNMANMIKMQKLLSSYRSFISEKQKNGEASSRFNVSQDTLMEFFLSQLSKEQKSSFENISMVLNTMNK